MLLKKTYQHHSGVDRKSSDLFRPETYAEDMRNAEYSPTGAIVKRVGYQMHAADAGGYGLYTYRKADPVTGDITEHVVTVDQNLYNLLQSTITVVYSGINPSASINIFLDSVTRTYKCQMMEGINTVLDYDLGTGFDEASPITLANLKTQIDAVTNFAATISGSTTVPAAFLKVTKDFDLFTSNFTGIAKSWEQVYSPITNPLAAYYANRNNPDAENVSSIEVENCQYFGSGFNETYKYDGHAFYRAGLPIPAAPTVALVGGGSVTGTNYVHVIQYAFYDAAGNIRESNIASSSPPLNAAAQSFDITIPNVLSASGFYVNGAIVNGAQVSVTTITVDSGHTMQVGDIAYFYDGISAAYVRREVTARAATTITIAGAAVTVADNDVVSSNFTIRVFRSVSSGAAPDAFYLLDEIPNNPFVATQTLNDDTIDANLGEQLVPPATDRSPPPKGRYLSQWNGIMLIGGIPDAPYDLAYSDVDSCEYFPADTNRFLIETGNGDKIVGIGANNEVFTVHGDSSFTVLSGDILSGQVRIEVKARDSGCTAHASIQDLDGALVWSSPRGPRYSQGGQVPLPLGAAVTEQRQETSSRIDPEFNNDGLQPVEKLRFKRAVGFTDNKTQRYYLYIPAEDQVTGQVYANEFSKIYVYDKTRDAWLIWNNQNMAGGIAVQGDEFFFSERRYSAFEADLVSCMYRRMNLNDDFDYADNLASIDFDYMPQWDFLGEASILKKPLNLRVFSVEDLAVGEFTLTIEHEVNFQKNGAVSTFDMLLYSSGYGVQPYGTDPYGSPSDAAATHPLARDRIYSTRPRFKNNVIHNNVVITGWEVEFSTPYRPEFKPL